jgi:predicted enzyme related to lactoylglutathione lyase
LAGGPILGLDTIWLHIRDLERARSFYRKGFGLRELKYDPTGKWASFRVPRGPKLAMHRQGRGEPGRRAGTVSGIYFKVADVRRACRHIERHGGSVTDTPEKLPNGKWIATVADPDGNEFVLVSGR